MVGDLGMRVRERIQRYGKERIFSASGGGGKGVRKLAGRLCTIEGSQMDPSFLQTRQACQQGNMRLMRQMYSAVTIPKVAYTADVWYTPIRKKEGASRFSGSVGVTNKLASIQ